MDEQLNSVDNEGQNQPEILPNSEASGVVINGVECYPVANPLVPNCPIPTQTKSPSRKRTSRGTSKIPRRKACTYADFSDWKPVLGDLLKSKQRANYSFIIGEERVVFKVHKIILELRSDVFANQMDSSLELNQCEIADVEPRIFEYFINHVYTDELPRTISNADLFEVLNIAWHYNTDGLANQCLNYILERMGLDSCLEFLEISRKYCGMEEVGNLAVDFMLKNAKELFESEELTKMTIPDWRLLLSSGDLLCSEVEAFNAVIKWGRNKCNAENLGADQLRETVHELIPLIRFPLMTPEEIALYVNPTKVLTPKELVEVYDYVCASVKPKLETFITTPRKRQVQIRQSGLEQIQVRPLNGYHTTLPYNENDPECSLSNGVIDSNMDCDTDLHNVASGSNSCHTRESSNTDTPGTFDIHSQSNSGIISEEELPTPQILNCWSINEVHDSVIGTESKLSRTTNSSIEDLTPPSSDISIRSMDNSHTHTNATGQRRSSTRTEVSQSTRSNNNLGQSQPGMEIDTWERFIEHYTEASRQGRNSLELVDRLRLENCKVTNQYPQLEQSAMEYLYLDLKFEMECVSDYRRFERLFDLRKYVFFNSNENRKWKFEELWNMNIPITVIINGVTFLKMNQPEKELILTFKNDSTDIMKGLCSKSPENNAQLRKLTLANTDLPPDGFPTRELEEVILYGVVDYFHPKLNKFLRESPNLRKLVCWIIREKFEGIKGVRTKQSIDLCEDLVSKDKLELLTISRAMLLYNPGFQEDSIKVGLTELYTDQSHFSPMIFEHFHLLFPNLRKFAFRYSILHMTDTSGADLVPYATVRLITNILKIAKIKWIRVWGMDWNSPGENGTTDLHRIESLAHTKSSKVAKRSKTKASVNSVPESEEVRKLNEFFESVAIRCQHVGKEYNLCTRCNFLLEKGLGTDTWTGRIFDDTNKEGKEWLTDFQDRMVYQCFQLETYNKDFDSYDFANQDENCVDE